MNLSNILNSIFSISNEIFLKMYFELQGYTTICNRLFDSSLFSKGSSTSLTKQYMNVPEENINKLIVITRSKNGSVAILDNTIINCESHKVEKVLDLTGAGDLFASGFLKEYLDKSNIKKCLEIGSEVAAKIIQKIGARLN